MCICMYTYIYIYIYIHTHTYATHLALARVQLGLSRCLSAVCEVKKACRGEAAIQD